MTATNKVLLTSGEVAQKLRKPVSWVYNNVMQEQIPFIKLGQQYRFDEEAIDKWIQFRMNGEF